MGWISQDTYLILDCFNCQLQLSPFYNKRGQHWLALNAEEFYSGSNKPIIGLQIRVYVKPSAIYVFNMVKRGTHTVKKISLNRSAGKFKGHGRSLHVEEAFFFGAE